MVLTRRRGGLVEIFLIALFAILVFAVAEVTRRRQGGLSVASVGRGGWFEFHGEKRSGMGGRSVVAEVSEWLPCRRRYCVNVLGILHRDETTRLANKVDHFLAQRREGTMQEGEWLSCFCVPVFAFSCFWVGIFMVRRRPRCVFACPREFFSRVCWRSFAVGSFVWGMGVSKAPLFDFHLGHEALRVAGRHPVKPLFVFAGVGRPHPRLDAVEG